MCKTMPFVFGMLTPQRTNFIVGVSIIIGAIGGVYLLQRGARYVCQITEKKVKKKPEDICNVCFSKLEVEDFKSCVSCCNCQKFVCRGRQCSIWLPSQAGWECQLCSLSCESRSRASEWLHQQINEKYLRPMSSRSNPSIPIRDNEFDVHSDAPSSYCSEQREKVREYVEETLASMLGGSLDNVSVGQMFRSREYLPLYENEECPGVSHVKLKRLIEKIVKETLRLPNSLDYSGVSGRPEENLPFFDPKKYQELLATAVLNKIVDSYNYEKKFETENNEDLDKNHNPIIANKRKILQQSSSSIEPGSDSSLADATIHIRRDGDAYTSDTDSNFQSDLITGSVHTGDESVLSDYISKHKVPLPELSLDTESPDDDIMSVVTSKSEGNWEDNWLFKKKKRGNETPVSVGMLVPSPREDVKTLIGDKTADEISDLSEGSDFEDIEDVDNKTPNDTDLPNVLIQNKNVIGGKSTVGLFDELLEQTSLISTTSVPEGEAIFNECKNDFILTNDGLDDVQPAPKLDLTNNHHQVIVESEAVNSNVTDFLTNGTASHKEHAIEDVPLFAPPQDFDDADQPSLEQASNSISECEAVTVEKIELPDETASNLDSLSQAESTEPLESSTDPAAADEDIEDQKHKEISTNLPSEETTQTLSTTVASAQLNSSLTNQTNNSETNDPNTLQRHIKLEALKNSSFSQPLGAEENPEDTLGHLLPGSIAERERLKWYQAVEMPNNPYAPEALKHRLSIGSEKPMDIPNKNISLDLTASQDQSTNLDEDSDGSSKLQIVLGADKPDQKRYGRDYYINDAKYACGTNPRSEILKESRLSLSLNEDDHQQDNKVKQCDTEPTVTSSKPSVQRSSSFSEKRVLESCDLFTARPVRVEESDPILNKAIKLEYLSTPERDFYLLPSEEVEISKSSNQSETSSQISQNLDSLTASEDSDTIRVYDLKSQETRILKDEKVRESPDTADSKKPQPNILSFTPKTGTFQQPKKITTPTSLKFLQPKRKPFDPRRIMSVDSEVKSPIFDNNNTMSASVDSQDKMVIEEEIISALPSVKALAKAFSVTSPDTTPIVPSYKTKIRYHYRTTSYNSVDVKTQHIPEGDHEETQEPVEPDHTTEEINNVLETVVEQTNSSIEFAETDHHDQHDQHEEPQEEDHTEDHSHHHEIELVVKLQKQDSFERQERPISPVLVPGLLKNNIAFFENLKNK